MNRLFTCLFALVVPVASVAVAAEQDNPVRPVAGEILPRFSNPNLLPNGDFDDELAGWTVRLPEGDDAASAQTASSEHGPVLRVSKGEVDGSVRIVSQVVAVKPDTDYLLTGLYHTTSARLGGITDFVVVEGKDAASLREVNPLVASRSAHPGYTLLLNSPEGEWRRKTRTFRTGSQTQALQVTIVLAGPAMTVDYDNLYLAEREADTREWDWPEREGRISLVQTKKRLAARPDSTAEVRTESGAARLVIDGKVEAPQVLMTDVTRAERGYISDFASHGLDIAIVNIKSGSAGYWHGPDEVDLAAVDSVLWDAVQRNPEGNIIVYFSATPYVSWHEDNPDDAAQFPDGTYAVSRHKRHAPPSYYSENYRRQVYEVLLKVVRHIHSQEYGRAVVGYFLTGGEDGQFYYQAGKGGVIQDGHGPADLPLFREWLRGRYESVEALRRAWDEPEVTFDDARPLIRTDRVAGNFLHPVRQRKEVDTLMFLNDSIGELLVTMGRICKENAGKPVVTGAYYGRGRGAMVYPHFAQTRVVFDSPYLDYMGAQGGYYGWREAGNSGNLNWVFDSLRLHGKIPMLELDSRTWISEYKSMEHDYKVARYWSMEEFVGASARDAGNMIAVDGGAWWMEMSGGWFRDESIMEPIGTFRRVAQSVAETPRPPDEAELVFVIDEDGYFWTTEQTHIWNGPNYHSNALQQTAISRSGLRYQVYYLDDLIERGMDDFKVYVFQNVYQVDGRKRAFLEGLKRDGKTLVWQYAPGFITPEDFSTESMSALTGIQLRLADDAKPVSLRAHFVGEAERAGEAGELLAGISTAVMGLGRDLAGQRFVVEDDRAGVIGRYVADDAPAAAVKRFEGYTSIYVGHPSGLTDRLLNNIARAAGAHVHTEPGDLFMCNRSDFMVIHGVQGGERTIRLPEPATITDAFDGRVLAENATQVTFPLRVNETRWLRIAR